MLTGTCFWCDAVLVGRQGLLYDVQGLESAYLQHDCFGSVTADKVTHQSLNLWNDCDWNCHVHTLALHEAGVLWDFYGCSCGAFESSFDSINLKSDHICCILCIGTSLQDIGIPVHEWNHHTYYSDLASYVFSMVVRFLDLVCHLTFQSLVWFLLPSWSSLIVVSVCGKVCSLVSHQVNLTCLWVSSYLFDMMHSGL